MLAENLVKLHGRFENLYLQFEGVKLPASRFLEVTAA